MLNEKWVVLASHFFPFALNRILPWRYKLRISNWLHWAIWGFPGSSCGRRVKHSRGFCWHSTAGCEESWFSQESPPIPRTCSSSKDWLFSHRLVNSTPNPVCPHFLYGFALLSWSCCVISLCSFDWLKTKAMRLHLSAIQSWRNCENLLCVWSFIDLIVKETALIVIVSLKHVFRDIKAVCPHLQTPETENIHHPNCTFSAGWWWCHNSKCVPPRSFEEFKSVIINL